MYKIPKYQLFIVLFISWYINITYSKNASNSVTYFDFIPEKVSTLNLMSNISNQWSSKCFYKNNVSLKLLKNIQTTSNITSLQLEIRSFGKKHFLCGDTYLLGTNKFLHSHYHFMKNWKYTYNLSPLELKDIRINGFNIYLFPKGILYSLVNIIHTSKLFNSKMMTQYNLDFLNHSMNLIIQKNNRNKTNYNISDFRPGDIFLITRLDGLDPLIMYGTGSISGHTAMVLNINNSLHVCESTDNNPFGKSYWPPPYGIISTPLPKWLKLAYKTGYIVSVIRLSDFYYNIWNQTQSLEYFLKIQGMPYGYHNLLFGWLDTYQNNLPNRLSGNLLTNIVTYLERHNITITNRVFREALNHRIGNYNLSINQVLDNSLQQNESFWNLFLIPEQDKWNYSDGKSYVCNTMVLALLKAGGIFGNVSSHIQVTEFTPKDLYTLQIYNPDFRLKNCLDNNFGSCQILGNYQIHMESFNSVIPYINMNQKCNSLPPKYIRNNNC